MKVLRYIPPENVRNVAIIPLENVIKLMDIPSENVIFGKNVRKRMVEP
jgi:hypothetical protein